MECSPPPDAGDVFEKGEILALVAKFQQQVRQLPGVSRACKVADASAQTDTWDEILRDLVAKISAAYEEKIQKLAEDAAIALQKQKPSSERPP